MANALILDSLEIHNFRGFRTLRIERLARVNLIVGKNNVGKTTLLEALQIYASRAEYRVIWQHLARRKESLPVYDLDKMNFKERFQALEYLFYGRPELPAYPIENLPSPITIGPVASPNETHSLAVEWYKMVYNPELLTLDMQPLPADEFKRVQAPIPALVSRYGDEPEIIYQLHEDKRRPLSSKPQAINHIFLSTERLSDSKIESLRGHAIEENIYDEVDAALRLMVPELERTEIVYKEYSDNTQIKRQNIIAKLSKHQKFIPLGSLGEGVNRLFEIALALVNAQDGILLLDEIESGLYYSILPDVWRFIFKVANKLNVQLFVTSHSWECIEAFGEAVKDNSEELGLLISLREHQKEEGTVAAVLFDQEAMDIITKHQIEVR